MEFALAAGARPDFGIDTSGKPNLSVFFLRRLALQACAENQLQHRRVNGDKASLAELRERVGAEVSVHTLVNHMGQVGRRPTPEEC